MLTATHYIEFLSATGGALGGTQRYQPYFPNETRTFNGLTYLFSPSALQAM